MKKYVEEYYELLQQYYNDNILKINPDKTKYIIICDKKIKNIFNNFIIKADKYFIKPSNIIKILGIHISNDLTWDREIGKLSTNLHNENIRMAYGHPRSRSCGGLEGPFGPC